MGTPQTYTTAIAHTTDAQFRAWGLELSNALQAAGFVKTADTGQINWATVVRPAINTSAGYEIYRFDDALQGTYPIFFKLEYGATTSATVAAMWLTVATGSNGAGTLIGQSTSRVQCTAISATASTTTAYATYICHKGGFGGVMWKCGAIATAPTAAGFFTICRTVDDTGAETGDGFTVYRRSTANSASSLSESVSVLNATTFAPSNAYSCAWGGVAASDVGANKQVYRNYMVQPGVRPVMQMLTCISAEFPGATTLVAAMVGSTPRTYLSGGSYTVYAGANVSAAYCNAMLWES
jgi:hypothetical protein